MIKKVVSIMILSVIASIVMWFGSANVVGNY